MSMGNLGFGHGHMDFWHGHGQNFDHLTSVISKFGPWSLSTYFESQGKNKRSCSPYRTLFLVSELGHVVHEQCISFAQNQTMLLKFSFCKEIDCYRK